MGLAASQARLLTITARKSDCEYQSMAYSHQKIALARDMNIVSAEYQDALNQTKIIYDYYGTGDKATQLSYGLLMSPSQLNDFTPSPLTDPAGRIVLDGGLAAAARAAGIPQEGLGCTPSSDIRNKFIQGLMDNGVISRSVGNGVMNVQYNPNAGLGTSEMAKTATQQITFSEFMQNYLSKIEVDISDLTLNTSGSHLVLYDHATLHTYDKNYEIEHPNEESEFQTSNGDVNPAAIKLSEFLTAPTEHNLVLYGSTWDKDSDLLQYGGQNCIIDKVGSCSFWTELVDSLAAYIPSTDQFAQAAIEYAKQQTLAKVVSLSNNPEELDASNAVYNKKAENKKQWKVEDEAKDLSSDYVGYVYLRNPGHRDYLYNDGYNINLTNMTKAFYTYFAAYMEGLATTKYKVTKEASTSNFVTDDFNASDFVFNIEVPVDTSGDNVLVSNFYDTLFNQIATNGWVENNNVHDNEYMATMLRNGSMYLSAMNEDFYYYQVNYATQNYIKEVTDEEGIAVAEARYMREKEKINSKENILDMKMKNLDTEITALTTEYDTVKSVINNNIKTGFSRYKA